MSDGEDRISDDGRYRWNGSEWLPTTPTPPPTAPPQYSPDGRYWWNGTEWVGTQAPSKQGITTKDVVIVAAILLIITAVGAVFVSMRADNAAGDDVDDIMCQQYGECD